MSDNTVKNIITRFTKQASKVIDYNVPSVYGTFYNINTDATVLDTNFTDTLDTTGPTSGLKWDRFKNVPFFFGEQIQKQLNIDTELGISVKLLSNVVIPKRHLENITVNIGDAMYFDSVPLDYKQRLFFVSNVEYQSINDTDAIKLTLTPNGNSTIEEIENHIICRTTYNETAKSFIKDDQYKYIENIEDKIRQALRLFNDKFKFGWLPFIFKSTNLIYFVLDVYTVVIKYIMPLKPKNYNLRYSLILDHEYNENDSNSFFEMLFNPRYNRTAGLVYTTKFSQCDLNVLQALYDDQFYDTVHPNNLSISTISDGSPDDLLEVMYGVADAAKVVVALDQFSKFLYNDNTIDITLIDTSIFLNEMLHDYIRYRMEDDHPFPNIDDYLLNQKSNSLELLFFLKFMFELLHR